MGAFILDECACERLAGQKQNSDKRSFFAPPIIPRVFISNAPHISNSTRRQRIGTAYLKWRRNEPLRTSIDE
jgi:hypothetical protein